MRHVRATRIDVVAGDIHRVPRGDGREWVYCADTGRALLVSSSQAELAARAREPSSVLIDRASRAEVDRLLGHGLLRRLDDLHALCRRTGKAAPTAAIRTVAIVTRDRPRSLARCITSYATHLAAHGREARFLVLDDAPSAAAREATRARLSRLGARLGIALAYAGREEKRAFADALARSSGAPPELVQMGLLGLPRATTTTVGANRNAMLLACAGEVVLGVDDDTAAELAVPRGFREGDLAVSSDADPHDYWFPADRDRRGAGLTSVRRDLVALHEAVIGQPVAALIAGAARPTLRPAADFARRIASGEARVVLTSVGLHGAAPMTSGVDLLHLGGPSRCRLLGSERAYRAALASARMVRMAPRVTLTDSAWAMTYASAIDARALLPPFSPLHRGEDDLFALVLRIVAPGGAQASLPVSIAHAVDDERTLADPLTAALAAEPVRMLRALLEDYRARGREPWQKPSCAEAMRALGRHVLEAGSLPARGVAELARWLRFRWMSDEIALTSQALVRHRSRPRFWQREALAWRRRLEAALDEPIGGRTERALARLMEHYGRLLLSWPELYEAARTARARGLALAP